MTDADRHTDLVSEMYALVAEQAPTRELTSQVIDHVIAGEPIVHGPWTADECQSVLLPWLAAGWIDLIADAEPPTSLNLERSDWHDRSIRDGEYYVLARDDAYRILSDPSRWRSPTADAAVMLCSSEEGNRHEYAEWFALVRAS